MIKEQTKIKGIVNVKLFGPDGKIKVEQTEKNLVVTTGLAHIVSRMLANTNSSMTHMAIGSGITAVTAADTTLETELAREAFTSATSVGSVITYVGTYAAGTGTGAVAEAGIFNNVSAGTMLNRVTFASINKGALDSMVVTWSLTIG